MIEDTIVYLDNTSIDMQMQSSSRQIAVHIGVRAWIIQYFMGWD